MIRHNDGTIAFGGRDLMEGEESVLPPIGPLAQAIESMDFMSFARLMIALGKLEQKKYDVRHQICQAYH